MSKKSAISKHWQAEIQNTENRHRAQRIETPQIKKITTAQAEIQRRIRAQRIETTKINLDYYYCKAEITL